MDRLTLSSVREKGPSSRCEPILAQNPPAADPSEQTETGPLLMDQLANRSQPLQSAKPQVPSLPESPSKPQTPSQPQVQS